MGFDDSGCRGGLFSQFVASSTVSLPAASVPPRFPMENVSGGIYNFLYSVYSHDGGAREGISSIGQKGEIEYRGRGGTKVQGGDVGEERYSYWRVCRN